MQKRSQAQSELFRKHSFHPMGGCLPMFVQLPIFLGLYRALAANMVLGVERGFERKLEIQGVGYSAKLEGKALVLQIGFNKPVKMPVPEGVSCEVPGPTNIVVRGADKQRVGQFAAEIRRVRPPEPYKGKGIRYEGEYVRRKVGKSLGA